MSDAPPPPTTARTLAIEGRVQGVGYRDAMVEAAIAAGVRGTVCNADDGRVLAHVQGSEEAVAAIIAWASHGPRHARVTRVLVEAAEPDPAHATFRRTRQLPRRVQLHDAEKAGKPER